MKTKIIKPKTKTVTWSPLYNMVMTKNIKPHKKGDVIMKGMDSRQFADFLGKNGRPIGFCGNVGFVEFAFSKEIMDNISVEVEYITVTTETHKRKLSDFK